MLMEKEKYIEYMQKTVSDYSKPVQQILLGKLLNENMVSDKDQMMVGQDKDTIDITQCNNSSEKLTYALCHSQKALKEIELWEFTKNYKYSIPCEISDYSDDIIEILKEKGASEFSLDSQQYDELLDSPSHPTILRVNDDTLFLKFSIKQDTYNPLDGKQEIKKRTVVLYILKQESYAEFRFDFISPYDQAKIFDIAHYLGIIKDYLTQTAKLRIDFMELDGLTEYVTTDKNLNIVAQDMRMADGSKAVLQAASSAQGNETYVLPFLGELENIIKEYTDDLNSIPKFKDVLINFIEDKKATSDLPWVTIKWENGTDTKFTFNYKSLGFCLVQHYCSYNLSDIGMERMNHVAKYIVRYRKLLTNKGIAEQQSNEDTN